MAAPEPGPVGVDCAAPVDVLDIEHEATARAGELLLATRHAYLRFADRDTPIADLERAVAHHRDCIISFWAWRDQYWDGAPDVLTAVEADLKHRVRALRYLRADPCESSAELF